MMEEGLRKRLMSSIKCGSCGKKFDAVNVEVLGNSDEMWFLQAICSACHTESLVVAIIQKCKKSDGVNDLTKAELVKLDTVSLVDADDLLNMHHFLKGFAGDFSCLFGQKKY